MDRSLADLSLVTANTNMPTSSRENRSISYDEALTHINELAKAQRGRKHSRSDAEVDTWRQNWSSKPQVSTPQTTQREQTVSIFNAVGRISSKRVFAPHATPRNDTSAMDGFAVCSAETSGANPDHPMEFRVVQCIAAGDLPGLELDITPDFAKHPRVCVEIMTGACFPLGPLSHLDAVVKVEDIVDSEDWPDCENTVSRSIQITTPVKPLQHRRPAGSDIPQGDLLLRLGEKIEPKHIAALSSVGIHRINVQDTAVSTSPRRCSNSQPRPKVAVCSTGSEVVDIRADVGPPKHKIPDSNGPYLTTALQRKFTGVDVEYLGVIADDVDALYVSLMSAIYERECDVLITSGGVSKGRHDLIRYVLETRMKAHVVFHGVRVRPGGPILLAVLTIPACDSHTCETRQVVCFGVPGNPVAAASALEFFIAPYLRALMTKGRHGDGDTKSEAMLVGDCGKSRRKPYHCTAFWLATMAPLEPDLPLFDPPKAILLQDQASYKVKNVLLADCWVRVPEGIDSVQQGERFAQSAI